MGADGTTALRAQSGHPRSMAQVMSALQAYKAADPERIVKSVATERKMALPICDQLVGCCMHRQYRAAALPVPSEMAAEWEEALILPSVARAEIFSAKFRGNRSFLVISLTLILPVS